MQKYLIAIVILFSTLASSCSHLPVYRPDRQQGNILDQKKVDQLHTGMTTKQVVYIMGTPMLEQSIDPARVDYVYTFKPGGKPLQEKRMTLIFRHGKLVRFEGSVQPGMKPNDEQAVEQQIAKQIAKEPKPVTRMPVEPKKNTDSLPQPF